MLCDKDTNNNYYSDDDCNNLDISLSQSEGVIDPGSACSIAVVGTAVHGGLYRRRITFENLTCPGQECSLTMQFFVDTGVLKVMASSPLPYEIDLHSSRLSQ